MIKLIEMHANTIPDNIIFRLMQVNSMYILYLEDTTSYIEEKDVYMILAYLLKIIIYKKGNTSMPNPGLETSDILWKIYQGYSFNTMVIDINVDQIDLPLRNEAHSIMSQATKWKWVDTIGMYRIPI